MGHDNTSAIRQDRGLEDFARMDDGAIQGSSREFMRAQEVVLGRKAQQQGHFHGLVKQYWNDYFCDQPGGIQSRADFSAEAFAGAIGHTKFANPHHGVRSDDSR
jgi:hypothetical protein